MYYLKTHIKTTFGLFVVDILGIDAYLSCGAALTCIEVIDAIEAVEAIDAVEAIEAVNTIEAIVGVEAFAVNVAVAGVEAIMGVEASKMSPHMLPHIQTYPSSSCFLPHNSLKSIRISGNKQRFIVIL